MRASSCPRPAGLPVSVGPSETPPGAAHTGPARPPAFPAAARPAPQTGSARPALARGVAVVAALEAGHVDLDLLRRAPEQERVDQAVASLVHGQQGSEVSVALAQPVDLEGRGDGARLATPMRDQAATVRR